MRKLTAGLFMSLDGVVESPNLWQFDSFDEELGVEMTAMITRVDTVLLGRVGYEQWAGYWPNAEHDDPFGAFINPVEKFVASRTLNGDLAWQNSTLIPGDLNEFVTNLKNTEGGEISVVGGISLVRQLLFAGLLDSLTVMTHPVIAGVGRHLFEPTDPVTRLTLQTSLLTSRGNALLTYGLRTD
ncbi:MULTISPECIES: dihydrofolate reductase family protein [Cryobacterium]|uniref:Dihydrofolate reductase n=1 Tax=Cryobacterium levicorallinum TaxID=995038 RepID=A0A1I3BJC3_9MICO|nr:MULTISPECIES: dihydrofolate reductase family protein [Cryobacterium]TFB82106.1 dihydrofolate reductase [Cryobacterium levicorallinum]TFD57071.1 dihydrofolate reductase [Cryobacterium sp. Hh38]GEP28046.1 deaminase reductase [Cryobacterium levicorallinum]SFH62363.1 Dihydrofolate reductase [Cryobacterium levicorallinum]